MALGCIGQYIRYQDDEVNTYYTRDGGLSWTELAKGAHIFDISNRGSILVMAKGNLLNQIK